MSKVLSWLTGVAFACASGIASASCACQCFEGVARTLCTTLDEAQANPSACGLGQQVGEQLAEQLGAQKVACETAPPVTESIQRYEPPQGAVDCRDARLWDPRSNSYAVIAKVCDIDRGVGASQ